MGRWRGVGAVLATAAALAGPAAAAGHVGGLQASGQRALVRQLGRALLAPHLRRSREGAVVLDLASGRTIYAANATRPLAPASNEKLAVTFAALVRLGPDYRFRTDVLGRGYRRGSTWHGDLYLQGHGDPALHTSGLVRLARTLHAEGIRRVTGRVRGDESWFDARRTAPGWSASFYMSECPPLSALVVNRATFRGRMTPDPAGAAAAIFTGVLQRHGIRVLHGSGWGTAPASARRLAEIASQPLAVVLRFMDHESDNFTAEMLLKTLGAQIAGRGTTAAGARVVAQTLARAEIPLAGVRLVDGSGLSRLDRLTAATIATILERAWDDRRLRYPFWRALAVAGRSGTLAYRLTSPPALGRIHGKTGTTDIASALSGFVGDRFAFSILQNGHPIQLASAHAAQDRFATALARR